MLKGHGWVTPNPDGTKARCGGPSICSACKAELDALNNKDAIDVLSDEEIDAMIKEAESSTVPPIDSKWNVRRIAATLDSMRVALNESGVPSIIDRPLTQGEIRGLRIAVAMLRGRIRYYERLPHYCNAATAVSSMADRIEDAANTPPMLITAEEVN